MTHSALLRDLERISRMYARPPMLLVRDTPALRKSFSRMAGPKNPIRGTKRGLTLNAVNKKRLELLCKASGVPLDLTEKIVDVQLDSIDGLMVLLSKISALLIEKLNRGEVSATLVIQADNTEAHLLANVLREGSPA